MTSQHLLDIRHRPDGAVVIKRYPFETVLNMDEWKELSEYCATHSSQQAEQSLWTSDELIQHEKMAADAAREKALNDLKVWCIQTKCNGCPYGGNLFRKIDGLRQESKEGE